LSSASLRCELSQTLSRAVIPAKAGIPKVAIPRRTKVFTANSIIFAASARLPYLPTAINKESLLDKCAPLMHMDIPLLLRILPMAPTAQDDDIFNNVIYK
jgi:hypothetical protein